MAQRLHGRRDTEATPERVPRAPLGPRDRSPPEHSPPDDAFGMTHDELVDALRAIEGLVDVGRDPPNFHFRSQPFLHFHVSADATYADVRFGAGDFEPVWASTPRERQELLGRVHAHVERIERSRKSSRRRSRPRPRGRS